MITEEQAQRLVSTGRLMRNAQKSYFKTRTPDYLKLAKRFEEGFDKLLIECTKQEEQGILPGTPKQQEGDWS